MLQLHPTCDNCNRALLPASTEARIGSFECTFCATCVEQVLHNVCPNCGGGLERRPVRPAELLATRPASTKVVSKPVDLAGFAPLLARYRDVAAHQR